MARDLASLAAEMAPAFVREFDASSARPINSEEQVREVERALGVALPPSYRAFLLYFNDYLAAGPELHTMAGGRGISGARFVLDAEESEDDPDVLWATDIVQENRRLRERPSWLAKTKAGDEWWAAQPKWPDHLIEIATSGGDLRYLLDLSRTGEDGECPVIGNPPEGDAEAASFVAFVRRYLD